MPDTGLVRRTARGTAGLALGGLAALVELVFLLVAVPALAVPAARRRVHARARRLAVADHARAARYLGAGPEIVVHDGRRVLRYLVARTVVGLFGVGVFGLILAGSVSGAVMGWQMVTGRPVGGGDPPEALEWTDPLVVLLFGSLLAFLAVWGLIGVAQLEGMLVRHYLGPSERERLRRRVAELAESRAGVVDAVNQERRRIERDLHDGVQQRLVALGMLLGRARRTTDQARAGELVRLAHEEAQRSLRDLREVSWRVFPIALDQGGLRAALESVAERSSVPVRLDCELAERPDPATETVAYFVVSEAVTNAVKHGAPERIDIAVRRVDGWLEVRVRDDGGGGAQAGGTGLGGLARRVAAADGELTVDSPVGGPTVVAARLPCG